LGQDKAFGQDDSEQQAKIFIFFPSVDVVGNFLTKRVFTGKCWFSQNYFSSISFPENTSFFVSFCCWRTWASGINGSNAVLRISAPPFGKYEAFQVVWRRTGCHKKWTWMQASCDWDPVEP